MGLKKIVKKYKSYEAKALSDRAAKKKKLLAYKKLSKKKGVKLKKKIKLRFSKKNLSRAIGNPYNVKL